MDLVCLDLEGVLVPEVWIHVAESTGIAELRLTTRDEPDYDVLMRRRLAILEEHGLGLPDIEAVIARMEPLEGADAFLAWLRERYPAVIIVSDTFRQFARPLMRRLGWPTLLCHELVVDARGRIRDYRLRQPEPKRRAVRAFRELAYRVIAAGDSYNDTAMLREADAGILFRPPRNVAEEFPEFPVTETYAELREAIEAASRSS